LGTEIQSAGYVWSACAITQIRVVPCGVAARVSCVEIIHIFLIKITSITHTITVLIRKNLYTLATTPHIIQQEMFMAVEIVSRD
jgi:hypothetical protein